MDVFQEEIVHLPDIQFVSLCRDNFGLNKGVYNEIDSWFYKNGIKNITNRRKHILQFLNSKTDYIVNGMNFIILIPCTSSDLKRKKGSTSPSLV